jgi:hypothetical protein
VAGGVPDREQDRLVEPLSLLESFLTPRPPMNRIVFVLLEVGASFFAQTI